MSNSSFPSTRNRRRLSVVAAGAATLAVVVPLGPAQGADSTSKTEAESAQAGCVLRSFRLYYSRSPRSGKKYMVLRSSIGCSRSTAWKVSLQIRRRRSFFDQNVADRQFRGTGSAVHRIAARCRKGQSFNGNFTINIFGGGGGGVTASRVIKNKKCG